MKEPSSDPSRPNPIAKDPLQQRLETILWLFFAGITVISAVLCSFRFTVGVVLGGLISIVNYYWLNHDLRQVFKSLNSHAQARIMFKYYLRFGVTAVVLYFIISGGIADIFGLLIGLSVVIVNMVLTAIMALTKKNCVEEVN
ncbi:MAG: ATP synthase subunit I [Syntrophales bacterium]|nr:ATP synthase subunit I [Syntrophales bacterium]